MNEKYIKKSNKKIAEKRIFIFIFLLFITVNLFSKIMGTLYSTKETGATPLILASQKGNLEKVKELIANGAGINETDRNKNTALIIAASRRGRLEIVKYLVSKGADVNAKNWMGHTALQWATLNKHTEIVKFLIDKDKKAKQDSSYERNLILSALSQRSCRRSPFYTNGLSLAKYILFKKTNFSLTGQEGYYFLTRFSGAGDLKTIRYIISQGADVNFNSKEKYLPGTTPLIEACKWGNLEVVKFLISEGAKVNPKIVYGETPLISASRWGRLKIVQYLLSLKKMKFFNKVKINAKIKQGYQKGKTAYQLAKISGHKEVASYLKNKGGK